jgi:RHS repeat-associated protein
VTPDAKAVNRTVGAQSDTFWVWNCGTTNDTYDLTCTATGTITCTGLSQTTVALTAGATTTILASYSAGAGSGQLTLTAVGWAEATSDSGWYAITVGAPLVDATPYNPAKQDYARCAERCFAATYAQGTVPYVSLDAPRNVVLVYNGDRVDPKPFVHVNATPDPGTSAPSEYQLKVKLNGAFVTFLNGEQTLRFAYGGTAPQRLGGQFNASSYATGVYPMEIHVSGLYGGVLRSTVVTTQFVTVNETTAPTARGWTLAGIQRVYFPADGSKLVTEGDGSAVLYAAGTLAPPAGEFSALRSGTPSGGSGWTRAYPDSTKAVFNTAGRMIEVRDRFNNIATVVYDAANRVSQIKDPLNLAITLAYNANGLSTITDPAGRVTTVTVNAAKRLTAIRDPDNVSTTFGYDGSQRLLTITNRRGHATTLGYDVQSGKLATATAPAITVVGTNGADSTVSPVTTLAPWQKLGVPYSATAGTPAPAVRADTVYGRVTDPGGHQTRFTVNRWGTPAVVTDALAGTDSTRFDANGLPIRVAYASGGIDTLAYNASGLPTYVRSGPDSATYIRYAAWAQPDSVWGWGRTAVRDSIGANGRVVWRRLGGQTAQTRFYYDVRGRRDSTRDALNHLVQRTWYLGVNGTRSKDSLPGGRITRYWQDGFGRDTAVQGPGQPVRRVHYDVLNRPIRFYDGVYATPTVTAYDALYDTSVTDAKGQVYRAGYNALGWVIRRTDPAGKADTLRYSRDGELRKWKNRRGQEITYTYDALHRVTAKSGTNTTTESWTYSADARVLTSTDPLSTETVYLGISGRADSVKTVLAGQTYWRRYRWTAAGLLDSVAPTGPLSFQARKYVWNTQTGTLAEIRLGTLPTLIGYDSDLIPVSTTLPGGDAITHQYSALHQEGEQTTTAPYASSVNRFLGFDAAGRLWRHILGDGVNGTQYAYDGLGRLTADSAITYQGPPGGCTPPNIIDENGNDCTQSGWVVGAGEQFAYDSVGNRTDSDGSYTTGNRITGFAGCTYTTDFDGNVTQRSCPGETVTFTWSAEGRLTGMTVNGQAVAFEYDAAGRLLRKSVGGVVQRHLLWDGASLLAELNGTGTGKEAEYSYYPGLDNPHALIVGATQYFAHTDGLGNVIALTDTFKNVQRTYAYGPWGVLTGGTDYASFAGKDRARFKGALWLGPEAEVYYMRARWYEPKTGRFLSEDPIGLKGGIDQSVFAHDDPVNGRDPSGLDGPDPCPRGYEYTVTTVTHDDGTETTIEECVFVGLSGGSSRGAEYDDLRAPGTIPVGWHGTGLLDGRQSVHGFQIKSRLLQGCGRGPFAWRQANVRTGLGREWSRVIYTLVQVTDFRRQTEQDWFGYARYEGRLTAWHFEDPSGNPTQIFSGTVGGNIGCRSGSGTVWSVPMS